MRTSGLGRKDPVLWCGAAHAMFGKATHLWTGDEKSLTAALRKTGLLRFAAADSAIASIAHSGGSNKRIASMMCAVALRNVTWRRSSPVPGVLC